MLCLDSWVITVSLWFIWPNMICQNYIKQYIFGSNNIHPIHLSMTWEQHLTNMQNHIGQVWHLYVPPVLLICTGQVVGYRYLYPLIHLVGLFKNIDYYQLCDYHLQILIVIHGFQTLTWRKTIWCCTHLELTWLTLHMSRHLYLPRTTFRSTIIAQGL